MKKTKTPLFFGVAIATIFSLGCGYLISLGQEAVESSLQDKILEVWRREASLTESDWENEDEEEGLTDEETAQVEALLEEFYERLQVDDPKDALRVYRQILAISHEADFFTGESAIDRSFSRRLKMIEWQLKKPGADTAKLAAERGSLEYEIGNHLYYLDGYEHRFSLLYHWLLACEHLDAANEMRETALAHRKKAEVLMDLGIGSSLAMRELERAIELDPSDSRAYYKLGNAYRQNRRSEDAISTYLKWLEKDPQNELMWLNLGITYFDAGKRKEWYAAYLKLASECRDYCNAVNYDIAIQKRDDGEYRSAVLFLDRAIEAAETKNEIYRDAYRLKGETLFLMGKGGEATEYLERSLNDEEDPPLYDNDFSYNNSEKASYYTLAKISLSLGNRDKAIEYLSEALELYPDDASLERLMEEAGGSKSENPKGGSAESDRFGSA